MLNLPPEPKNQHGIRILPGTAPDKDSEPVEAKRKPKKLGPAPAQPPWCDAETWALLLEMREGLR